WLPGRFYRGPRSGERKSRDPGRRVAGEARGRGARLASQARGRGDGARAPLWRGWGARGRVRRSGIAAARGASLGGRGGWVAGEARGSRRVALELCRGGSK